MPFRPEHSLLNLNLEKMHTIDTRSVENLFGLWTVFSKTSGALEDGKRLENLSWRLWTRETFCCRPETRASSHASLVPKCSFPPRAKSSSSIPPEMPELASSVGSVSSQESVDEEQYTETQPPSSADVVRPELTRPESGEGRSRGSERHITPANLEKICIEIKQKKELAPLSLPLPAAEETSQQAQSQMQNPEISLSPPTHPNSQANDATSQQLPPPLNEDNLESSASTVATSNSDTSRADHRSSDSSSTAMSTHNVVRGFVPGGASSSYRSQTQLATQPAPILKNSPRNVNARRKKGAMFTLGASSGEDDSSLDSHMHKSSLSEGLHRQAKHQSFRDDNLVTKVQDSPVFESDDEEDEDVSEGVIEDDEDSSDWEDELGDDDRSEADEGALFQRVSSRPNLTSRRSLLTSLMHEGDRATALAHAASRSTPALRRSRATSPSGPSLATSPQREPARAPEQPQMPGARQITFQRSKTSQQLALSPRTTRRNMLSSELTESLRTNLLWERQHKSSSNVAALKRRHTSHDVKNLRQYPDPQAAAMHKENESKTYNNDYFHAGLQEYHAKGW